MNATRTQRGRRNPKACHAVADAHTPHEKEDASPLPTSWVKIVHGPWRRPCWRWDLARWMRQEWLDPPEEFVDAGVLVALQLIDDPASVDETTRQALHLFLDGPPALRDMTEAYLLTGSPAAVVAGRCGIDVAVIQEYERHFFDVRPWLHARDWITLRAVGQVGLVPFRTEQIGRLWKATAFHGGLHPLDAVVAVSLEDGLVDGAEALPSPPVQFDDRTRRSTKLFIMAMMLPASTRLGHLGLLMEQVQRAEANSHGGRGHGSVADEVAARAEELLDEVLVDERNDLPTPPSKRSVA